jgi:4-hydroxy-2-oxoheptanedioate aldolase
MICIGPNDLAISLSKGQDRDIRSPKMLEAVEHVRKRAAAHGVITAIYANDHEFAKHVMATGWQVVSVATDAVWLSTIARQMLPR